MAVKSYKPRASILLKKNIGRQTIGDNIAASERFRGGEREVELMPYLGQSGSITVAKNVREPAGMWSVTLVDRMVEEFEDSLYGLIEPMDLVEIRFARDVSLYAGTTPKSMPLKMRGLVTSVRRDTIMTDQGARRAIILSGHDYGKILQMMQVQYLPGFVNGQDLLTAFRFVMNYGPGAQAYDSAAAFIASIVDEVVNKFIDGMREQAVAEGGAGASPIMPLGVDATDFGGGVSPFGVNQWPGGAIYDLMRYFGDVGPWAELFIQDREEGPFLVYRPTPFKALNGSLIQPGPEPKVVEVSDDALIQLSAERSDSGVANYYWVDAPRYALVSGALLQAAAQQEGATGPTAPQQGEYPNSAAKLYGLRIMKAESQQGQRVDGQPEAEYEDGRDKGVAMVEEKRAVLIANNKDNIVFEQGAMALRGDERIEAGCYIRLTRTGADDLISEHYAYQVVHEFSMSGFTTSVNYDRGTGFIERMKRDRGVNSPYLAELNVKGAYS